MSTRKPSGGNSDSDLRGFTSKTPRNEETMRLIDPFAPLKDLVAVPMLVGALLADLLGALGNSVGNRAPRPTSVV